LDRLDALAHCRGDQLVVAVPLNNLARNALAMRDARKAVDCLREAATTRPWDLPLRDWQFLMNCGGVAAIRGEWAPALRWTGVAVSIQERDGFKGDAVDAPFYAWQVEKATEALGAQAAGTALRAAAESEVHVVVEEAAAWLDAQATAPAAPMDTIPAHTSVGTSTRTSRRPRAPCRRQGSDN
jgi:hypothetical protein